MCIIHDSELHYVYQNIMDAFEQSKMLSALFLRRVGCLLCNCRKDMLYDSKTLISTQRALYKWFDEAVVDTKRQPLAVQRLGHFKPIVEEFRQNGRIDSGTKITFIALLKDLDAFDFSKLRRIVDQQQQQLTTSQRRSPMRGQQLPARRMNVFFTKLVKLKFDLKLCSIKEFCELLAKIDNCAIKYIQLTNKCKITLRDIEHLGIRNFMGEIDATIETRNEKNLYRAELSLKRLADAVHYRLAKQIPCSDQIVGGNSFGSLKILLQSPPQSLNATATEESSTDLSTSCLSSAADTTTTSNTSASSYSTNTSGMTTTTTTSTSNTSYTTTTTNTTTTTDASTTDFSSNRAASSSRSSNTLADSSLDSSATAQSSASSTGGKRHRRKHRKSPSSAQKKSTTSTAVTTKSSASKSKSKSKSKSPTSRADESVSSNSSSIVHVHHHHHHHGKKASPPAKKSHSHNHIGQQQHQQQRDSEMKHHHRRSEEQHHQKLISNSGRSNTFNHFSSVNKSAEKKKQPQPHHQHQHQHQSSSSSHYNTMADNLNLNFKKSRSSYSYKQHSHHGSSHQQRYMVDNLAY